MNARSLRAVSLSLLGPALALAGACGDGARDVAVLTAPVCVEHSPTLWGIDVSKWQGDIDWVKVKAAGVRYAFIRVSDGVTTIDGKFPQNWAGAEANGIPRGVYQFFRPNRDALEQAQIVIDHLAVHGMGELPPVIDVEATGEQTPATVAAQVGIWIDEIESTLGVRPIIYSGSYFWDDNVKSTAFSDYPFWIAHYTSAACPRLPAAWSDWTFWQYSSSGTVNGIAGDVDMNRYAGTMDELLDLVPDEVCRLDPAWRECQDDVASTCVDGQIESTPCGAGSSCVGSGCALDPPEPGPEPVESGPELAEAEPAPELVEPAPEVAEPVADVVEAPPDAATSETEGGPGPQDAATEAGGHQGTGTPSRTVSRREVQPGEGCAGARGEALFALVLGLWVMVLRRRRVGQGEGFERTSQRPTP